MDYPYKGDNYNSEPLYWKDLPSEKQQQAAPSTLRAVNWMTRRLQVMGGVAQQDRMIRDKRRTLDRAVLYSYQGALVKKFVSEGVETLEDDTPPARALINPNKLKADYDEKIISIGFEHNFHTGDVFEWINTDSHWLIYLQDLTELAYFRGQIRRCSYEIAWEDDNGNLQKTYVALRGPVETKIDYIQKHGISVDNPNYSLNILMPLNEASLGYFKRYSKFYLQGHDTCWRVEAIDEYSTPGILEVVAVEYYANETEDDVENGLVGAMIAVPADPNGSNRATEIFGETFIKPKKEMVYTFTGVPNKHVDWTVSEKAPVEFTSGFDKSGQAYVSLKWTATFSGQFDLFYGDYKKTIVVESLF